MRAADPVKYAFDTLRHNAKRRKIPFEISLQYFRKFCIKTNYIGRKGQTPASYSIDRDKNYLGYVPGNIKVLPLGENVKKYFSYDYQFKTAKYY